MRLSTLLLFLCLLVGAFAGSSPKPPATTEPPMEGYEDTGRPGSSAEYDGLRDLIAKLQKHAVYVPNSSEVHRPKRSVEDDEIIAGIPPIDSDFNKITQHLKQFVDSLNLNSVHSASDLVNRLSGTSSLNQLSVIFNEIATMIMKIALTIPNTVQNIIDILPIIGPNATAVRYLLNIPAILFAATVRIGIHLTQEINNAIAGLVKRSLKA